MLCIIVIIIITFQYSYFVHIDTYKVFAGNQ